MASIAETGTVRPGWRLSWTAVIAGALLAIAAHVVLGLVGTALGLAAAPSGSRALGAGAAAWGLVTPFVASLLGAWLAARLCGAAGKTAANLHGILVWCIGLVAGALFLTGTVATGALGAGAAASGNARAAERLRGDAGGPRTAREARARAEDAAAKAAAGTGGAALASIAGLLGAVAGAGISLRRGGRGASWRRFVERREGGRPPAGGAMGERGHAAGTYTTGAEPRTAPPPDLGGPSTEPYHH